MPIPPCMLGPRPHQDAEEPAIRWSDDELHTPLVAIVAGSAAHGLLALVATVVAWNIAGSGTDDALRIALLVCIATIAAGICAALLVIVRAPLRRAAAQSRELARAQEQLQERTLETFAALGAAVEAKDRYTAGHGLRVTLISILIGQELGLDGPELDVLRHAATFHDIGKIAVPDEVLNKTGRLTESEFEAMKRHPAEGARICAKLEVLQPAVPVIRSHHERMDGRGYPDGLVADDIPIGARIIAVADTWDAITSDRPYRDGQPGFVALEEIRRCAGSQFDHDVVRAFIEVLAKDPWMFDLTPEDLASERRLPAPLPASRGAELAEAAVAAVGMAWVTDEPAEIDWSDGFDELDLRAA